MVTTAWSLTASADEATVMVTSTTTSRPSLEAVSETTLIFANGLGYKYSDSRYATIMATGETDVPMMEVRAGNTIFRVCDAGVQISTNGGSTYKTL